MNSGTKPPTSNASVDARLQRLAAQVVAVVERDRAAALQLEHRAHVPGHRVVRQLDVRVRICCRAIASAASNDSPAGT